MSLDDAVPSFPERVGRYELLLPIGAGGMATVYLARVPVVGDVHREVALKLMHPFMQAEGRESTVSLLEEAKLAVRIRHPNVVPVIEVGDSAHGVFLVMEYVEGDTLSGLFRSARAEGSTMPLGIVGRILVDALAGLHAAHELKNDEGQLVDLVHRDFSPQNILVGVDGISRLTDFGVAKAAGRVNVTSSGIIKGKVAYMAPEQALGKKVDRRCDVWAAGVVAWEILSGQRLYKQEDQVATLLKIVNQAPPRLSTVKPEIARELDELVARALSMDVEQRIPSAAELRRRLTDAWKAVGGLAEPHEVGEYVQRAASTKIEARREQVSRVIKLRGSLAKVSAAAVRAAQETGTPSVGTQRPGNEETTSAISASSLGRASLPDADRPRHSERGAGKKLGVALIALFGLGAVLLGAAALVVARKPTAETAAASAASARPADEAKAPEPSPSVAAPAKKSRLAVEGNAAIKRLSVNGRRIELASPARTIEVELEGAEPDSDLELEAVAEDERKASAKSAKGTEKASLVFAPVRKGGGTAPAGKVVRDSAKPAPELPGLAPTPYGK